MNWMNKIKMIQNEKIGFHPLVIHFLIKYSKSRREIWHLL